jgi:hypothetical protein
MTAGGHGSRTQVGEARVEGAAKGPLIGKNERHLRPFQVAFVLAAPPASAMAPWPAPGTSGAVEAGCGPQALNLKPQAFPGPPPGLEAHPGDLLTAR